MRRLFQLLSLLVTLPLAAATYYVRTDGTNTNDGLTDSAAGAWRTIQHAADTMVAGDTAEIQTGAYGENIYTVASGSAGSPITFRADLDASTRSLRINGHTSIVVSGLQFTGANNALWKSHVRLEPTAHNCVITNCLFGPGIYVPPNQMNGMVFNSTQETVSNNVVDWAALGFSAGDSIYTGANTYTNAPDVFPYGYANMGKIWTIRGITNHVMGLDDGGSYAWEAETNSLAWAPVYMAVDANIGFEGILLVVGGGAGPTNTIIRGNTFSNLFGASVHLQAAQTTTIANNVFRSGNGWKWIDIYGTNIVVTNNLVLASTNFVNYGNAEIAKFSHNPPTGHVFYDYMIGFLHSSTQPIKDCEFAYNWIEDEQWTLSDLAVNAGGVICTNFSIHHNVFAGIGGQLEGGVNGLTITNNTFYRAGVREGRTYAMALGSTGITNVNILKNVFFDIGSKEITNTYFWYVTGGQNVTNDYNYYAHPETMAFRGMSSFTDAHGANSGDPIFRQASDLRGPDGLPFTDDDGLRPLPTSPIALLSAGALSAVTVTNNYSLPHFVVTSVSEWQDKTGTNYNAAWWAANWYDRTNLSRPWNTPEALGPIPLTVTFSATGSIAGTWTSNRWIGIKDFVWNFGDGSRPVWTKWPDARHTYLMSSNYNVVLTVTNSAGNVASVTNTYKVNPMDGFTGNMIFVSTNGSDSTGNGSLALPWRTIAKGVGLATNGDYVAILPGVYAEEVDMSDAGCESGTAAKPITVVAYNASTKRISQEYDWWTWEGLELTDPISQYTALFNMPVKVSGIVVRNFWVHDTTNTMAFAGDINGKYGTNYSFLNNMLNGIDGTCFYFMYRTNLTFDGNILFHTSREGDNFYMSSVDVTIRRNHSTDIGYANRSHVDWFSTIGDPVTAGPIRNYVIERNYANAGNTEIQIADQESNTNSSPGWTNIVYRNNVFCGLFYNGIKIHLDGARVHNNLFYQCGTNTSMAIVSGGGTGSAYSQDIRNNAFVQCGTSYGSNPEEGWYSNGLHPTGTNCSIAADYNFVCGTNHAAKHTAPPDEEFHWAITGQETHGINGGDPGFVDAANGDFRITTNSVLYAKGADLSAQFTTDFFGETRPATWSIGPFEAGVAGGGPTPPASTNRVIRATTIRAGTVRGP
jgi:hypothetical protein